MEPINIILPFITLVIGFLLGFSERYLDRRRKANNLRTILFWEIAWNNYVLRGLAKKPNDTISKIQKAAASQSFEYSVYEAYLSQINSLKPKEIDSILFAYHSIKVSIKTGDEFLEYVKASVIDKDDKDIDEEMLNSHSKLLLSRLEIAQETTSRTLSLFIKGREDLLLKLESVYMDS